MSALERNNIDITFSKAFLFTSEFKQQIILCANEQQIQIYVYLMSTEQRAEPNFI